MCVGLFVVRSDFSDQPPVSTTDQPPVSMTESSRRWERIEAAIEKFEEFEYSVDGQFNDTPPAELSRLIDHTLLKPDATSDNIRSLCEVAKKYNLKTVCVNSSWIELCDSLLQPEQDITVPIPIAVVGFPLGAGLTAAKAFEAKAAINAGAKEIDMVLHVGRLIEEDYDYVFQDIKAVYDACDGVPLKVILETPLLEYEDIVAACCICKEVGVAFVKTSTGFATGSGGGSGFAGARGFGGARGSGDGRTKPGHIALMKAVVGDHVQVKASGGIMSYDDAIKMLNAGATRIGASASIAIVSPRRT